jgi:hypothetical protein
MPLIFKNDTSYKTRAHTPKDVIKRSTSKALSQKNKTYLKSLGFKILKK